jgi:ACR3 family arsenite transporter
MIRRLLTGLKSNLIYAVIGSLAVGLLFGQTIGPETPSYLRLAVLPVLFLMIYPMMVNIDLREVTNIRSHAKPVLLTVIVNFTIAPTVAVVLANLFFPGSPEYAIGLYFIALIPTSGMTAAWTGLANGDLETALVAMAVNLLLAIIILPAYLSELVPASVAFDSSSLYGQLAQIVIIPMVAGALTRRLLVSKYGTNGFKRFKPLFGGVSSLGVMLIVFIAMSMRSASILADPIASAVVVIPLVIFYAVILAVGAGFGRFLLDTKRGVALVYATNMRNLSIAVAIVVATPTIPETAVLPIALAYTLQPPLGAIYMHYRRDIVDKERHISELVSQVLARG